MINPIVRFAFEIRYIAVFAGFCACILHLVSRMQVANFNHALRGPVNFIHNYCTLYSSCTYLQATLIAVTARYRTIYYSWSCTVIAMHEYSAVHPE